MSKHDSIYKLARSFYFDILVLASSKESAIKKYPQYKSQIEFFAQRDPTGGSLKYLNWEIKMLDTHQALQQEIAGIVDLFHKYSGQLHQKDLYQYNSFLNLRDKLYEIKAKSEEKKENRKRIYPPIDPEKIACGHKVIYDSPNFRCLQIINRAAAAHYGKETRWCIVSQETTGFDEFDKNNVIIFYVFNKNLTKDDPNYKLAFTYARDHDNNIIERRIINSRDIGLYGIFESSPEHASGNNRNIFGDKNLNIELLKIQEIMIEVAKSYPKSMMSRFFSDELSTSKMLEMFHSETNENTKTMLAAYIARRREFYDSELEQYLEEH